MVATNSAVAHLLGGAKASVPYRCHTPPDRPEVMSLNAKISALGIGIDIIRLGIGIGNAIGHWNWD